MRRTTRQSSAAASASGSQDSVPNSARSAPATEAVRKSGPQAGRECGADSKEAPPTDAVEKSAGDAEPATAPSAHFVFPALQANLFPMLHALDLCCLSLTCKNLRSILAIPEFAARVVVDVGPVKELLARARAVITGDESSLDVWLWQPPQTGDYMGTSDPIERGRDGIDDRWARGLIDMLEGNVEYLILRDRAEARGEGEDDSDWEDDPSPLKLGKGGRGAKGGHDAKGGRGGKGSRGGKGGRGAKGGRGGKGSRGRGRGDSPRSRDGTLARIAAMEAEPPITWLRNVHSAMTGHYFTARAATYEIAWLHCVRYGLDGLLPHILDKAHMAFHKPGVPGGMQARMLDGFITDSRRRSVFALQIRRNAVMIGAYLGHPNVIATLVRVGATCKWTDNTTIHAFLEALRHNRRDVVRTLCTPLAAGGCGLSLPAIPPTKSHHLTAPLGECIWHCLMDDFDQRQYQQIWLGPDFDPYELMYEGSRGRRRIRGG